MVIQDFSTVPVSIGKQLKWNSTFRRAFDVRNSISTFFLRGWLRFSAYHIMYFISAVLRANLLRAIPAYILDQTCRGQISNRKRSRAMSFTDPKNMQFSISTRRKTNKPLQARTVHTKIVHEERQHVETSSPSHLDVNSCCEEANNKQVGLRYCFEDSLAPLFPHAKPFPLAGSSRSSTSNRFRETVHGLTFRWQ